MPILFCVWACRCWFHFEDSNLVHFMGLDLDSHAPFFMLPFSVGSVVKICLGCCNVMLETRILLVGCPTFHASLLSFLQRVCSWAQITSSGSSSYTFLAFSKIQRANASGTWGMWSYLLGSIFSWLNRIRWCRQWQKNFQYLRKTGGHSPRA